MANRTNAASATDHMAQTSDDHHGEDNHAIDQALREILVEILGIDDEQAQGFDKDSGLFGALPEFDSAAVANILTALEERFDILIEDDEIEDDIFSTYGQLLAFSIKKCQENQ